IVRQTVVRASFGALAFLGMLVSCGSDGTSSDQQTPAERMCSAARAYLDQCGATTPCDEALVTDCAAVASIVSDDFLTSTEQCIRAGESPFACLPKGAAALTPTQAHRDLAQKFCEKCALGAPHCEELFFSSEASGGSGDARIGLAFLPFGDALANQVAEECASGLTCSATFLNCAQQVIARQAIPEETLACVFGVLTDPGSVPAAPRCEFASGGNGGSAGQGAGGNAGSAGSTAIGGNAGSAASGGSAQGGSSAGGGGGSGASSGSGSGGSGAGSCWRNADCSPDVCDPVTLQCTAACTAGSCDAGEACSASGGCYRQCTVGGNECPPNNSCFPRIDGSGVCVPAGSGAAGTSCTSAFPGQDCAPGLACVDGTCIHLCGFWNGPGNCPNAGDRCVYSGVCVAVSVESTPLGAQCTATGFCAPSGDRATGGCVSTDSGASYTCHALCRLAGDDCGTFEQCVQADEDGVLGVCL
ncbi:MAG: hypothetical protein KC492_36260, partial [Myxococcales bacterium]|nr:hypothetical protein [Myxococcales bacterium]